VLAEVSEPSIITSFQMQFLTMKGPHLIQEYRQSISTLSRWYWRIQRYCGVPQQGTARRQWPFTARRALHWTL